MDFSCLEGLVLQKISGDVGDEHLEIQASGRRFIMNHICACCESVKVESISGNITRAIGERINDAVEHSNSDNPPKDMSESSWTWTYYTIRTQSETIVIRWYGESNGYYSESIDFEEVFLVHHLDSKAAKVRPPLGKRLGLKGLRCKSSVIRSTHGT